MHNDYSQAFAFLGNSLLAPMTQTGPMGLDPVFWRAFPAFGDGGVAEAASLMEGTAISLVGYADTLDGAMHAVSAEYTRLFIGPPKPAAAPWETFYASPGATVGYGQPAVEMNRTLSSLGLEVGGAGNQYPDHMGIELLCLAEMHARARSGEAGFAERAGEFAADVPGRWADDFRRRVLEREPAGYYAALLSLVCALLRCSGMGASKSS